MVHLCSMDFKLLFVTTGNSFFENKKTNVFENGNQILIKKTKFIYDIGIQSKSA